MLSYRPKLWRVHGIPLICRPAWRYRWVSTAAAVEITPPAVPVAQIRLRPYQEDTIQSLLQFYKIGGRRAAVSLATGSGKTVVFTQLIERLPPQNDIATQTLILAHRKELVEQAYRHCKSSHPSKSVEIEQGQSHASGAADITVASIQSITRNRLEKYDALRFKLIIVDEAHHAVSESYLKILQHFGLRHSGEVTLKSPLLAGFTATLYRNDGMELGSVFDGIVYHKDYIEMIHENWLSSLIFTTVAIKADLSKVKTTGGDFRTAELAEVVNTSENNAAILRAWQERAVMRKSTLVFCVDVRHIIDLAATFRQNGIEARYVTGETRPKVRSETLRAFRNREFPVLLNCGVFTEGTDIPNIDCVLLARPTKSRNLLVQMIGRGTRLFQDKDDCHIIDVVSSLKNGVITTPTLFGLDPDELVKEATPADLSRLAGRRNAEKATAQQFEGSMTFTDYDSIDDLLQDVKGDEHIRALSRNAWVQIGIERYVLTTANQNYIKISKEGERFEVTFTQKMPDHWNKSKSPYMRPRLIATGLDLQHAIRAADEYAPEVFERIFISKGQAWRRNPASEKQLEVLNKSRDKDSQLDPDDLTKGDAIDMITKLKFGARGRYNKMAAERRKNIQEQQTQDKKIGGFKIESSIKPWSSGNRSVPEGRVVASKHGP
ncbi:DEAD/DEAH box helicase-like protein [Tothia fuscella]|uniref:DEAD/DEAH box helicase-like protein n=1 Tax=Tothia fuscella TaxID=1048955 RepID=A0A9P4TXP2_9PEZI|nr:DEAD/DEAH box helicase-like protein [Tothia fuscella]